MNQDPLNPIASHDSKGNSVSNAQLKVNQEALREKKKKHPAAKFRSRYDLKMDNWKDLDEGKFMRELEEIRSGFTVQSLHPNSKLGEQVARRLDDKEAVDTARSETSAQLLRQIVPKKEQTAHKVRKLKKKEDFRISGLPRAISVQDLQGKA